MKKMNLPPAKQVNTLRKQLRTVWVMSNMADVNSKACTRIFLQSVYCIIPETIDCIYFFKVDPMDTGNTMVIIKYFLQLVLFFCS